MCGGGQIPLRVYTFERPLPAPGDNDSNWNHTAVPAAVANPAEPATSTHFRRLIFRPVAALPPARISAASRADAGRSSGSRCRQEETRCSQFALVGDAGKSRRGGSSCSFLKAIASGVWPAKGRFPVSIWYAIIPTAYRSVRSVATSPLNCSGAIKAGVPTMAPGFNKEPGSTRLRFRSRARPKSRITGRSASLPTKRTLALFRSR